MSVPDHELDEPTPRPTHAPGCTAEDPCAYCLQDFLDEPPEVLEPDR